MLKSMECGLTRLMADRELVLNYLMKTAGLLNKSC